MQQLRTANEAWNVTLVTARAHELKGVAGTVGADELAALAATLETASRMSGILSDDAIHEIVNALDRFVTAVRAFQA